MKKKNLAVLFFATVCISATCSCSKDDAEENRPASDGITNGHAWVDLKLPSGTLWATCNVGASKPEDYGDYFAWSVTEPNVFEYSDVSYNFYNDLQTELKPEHDAATVKWGDKWQTPSIAQLMELTGGLYTTITPKTYGIMITSKSNGKSIFLPAAGYGKDNSIDRAGSEGFYWSRTPDKSRNYYAQYIYFKLGSISVQSDKRMFGSSIRPVRKQ